MDVYWSIFMVAAVAAAALEWRNRQGKGGAGSGAADRGFLAFKNNYLLVYSLMMGERSSLTWKPACLLPGVLVETAVGGWRRGARDPGSRLTAFESPAAEAAGSNLNPAPLPSLLPRSRRLAAGAARVPPVRLLWLRHGRHRQAVHRR